MKISIKLGWSDTVLFEGEYESTKHALQEAVKKKANLRGANLYGANLYGADLYGANLYGADLRGANLRGANLRGADLRGANLYGADLRGADLYGANLYGADLRGADLYGANLYGADLYGADGEKRTIYQAPVIVSGLRWDVMIYADMMQIGCEFHSVDDWVKFKPSRIKLMDSDAAKFWAANKEALLSLATAHAESHAKLAKEAEKQAA